MASPARFVQRILPVGENAIVVIKGAGDLASGAILRLHRTGLQVVATEIEQPTTVRRTVAFSEAIYCGEVEVEGLRARKIHDSAEIARAWSDGVVPVLVDPEAEIVSRLHPAVVVDAILAKRNLGTRISDAAVVVGLGPGFVAGVDVHAVIETNRGHHLGRVLWHGAAEPDTGVPGEIAGYGTQRLLRAPCPGVLRAERAIGDRVQAGDIVCWADQTPVKTSIAGVLRGLLHDGLCVHPGMKIGDVDPRAAREHCFTISDKSLAIAGGVLEAVFYLLRGQRLASSHGVSGR
jgi:xanthine dehydrogenase accessory factor